VSHKTAGLQTDLIAEHDGCRELAVSYPEGCQPHQRQGVTLNAITTFFGEASAELRAQF